MEFNHIFLNLMKSHKKEKVLRGGQTILSALKQNPNKKMHQIQSFAKTQIFATLSGS